jgi:hypothetical protein
VRYELDVRRWILPALGSVPLARLHATHVQQFYRERLEAGATPQAIKGYAMVLGRALQRRSASGSCYRTWCVSSQCRKLPDAS